MECLVQPTQEVRRNNLSYIAARQGRHGLSRWKLRQGFYFSDGEYLWCLLWCARRRKERRWRNCLYVCVQNCGERIADRAENGLVVRSVMLVQLVRRSEEFVSLQHKNSPERQPVAAVCHRYGGGLHPVVCKPGVD